jgi:hypothetical protein
MLTSTGFYPIMVLYVLEDSVVPCEVAFCLTPNRQNFKICDSRDRLLDTVSH